jgi:hypothetical protein
MPMLPCQTTKSSRLHAPKVAFSCHTIGATFSASTSIALKIMQESSCAPSILTSAPWRNEFTMRWGLGQRQTTN